MYLLMNVCENPNFLEIVRFILKALKLVFTVVPIVLIVFLTIDFVKCILNSPEDAKKNEKIIIKRIIYSACIFFVPMIVSVIVNMLGDLKVNYMECITNATDEKIASLRAQQEKENLINVTGSGSGSSGTSSNNSSSNSSNKNTNTNKNNSSTGSSSNKASKVKEIKFYLDDDSITLGHYKSTVNKYKIVVRNSKGKSMAKKKFIFESSNPAVAEVTSKGLVTAKFGGKAKITVAQNSFKKYKARC